jgi:hypothetical protein
VASLCMNQIQMRTFHDGFLSAPNLSRRTLKDRSMQHLWYLILALPILFISCNHATQSANINKSSPPQHSAGGNSSGELTLEEISSLCKRVSEIKVLPHKDEAVDDAAYNALIAAGEKAVPCLIGKITDTTSMADPRSAPTFHGMRVGDVAYFVLLDITKLDFIAPLPEPVREAYKTEGVDAYFRFVQNKRNREKLQSNLYEWYQKKYGPDARQL